MKRIFTTGIRQIPNTLTLLNLLSGSLSVLLAFRGYLTGAAVLIAVGFIFDITDGMAARMLKVQSPIGKELDSLADLITFGLAPAAILFSLQDQSGPWGPFSLEQPTGVIIIRLLPFLLPVFAGLRLAKFNIDERQHNQFIGLPTPANGLMVLSLPLVMNFQPESFLAPALSGALFIPAYSVLVAYLFVSPLHLYSLKIKGFGLKQNRYPLLLAIMAVALVAILGFTGLFLVIPAYILFAGLLAAGRKEKG